MVKIYGIFAILVIFISFNLSEGRKKPRPSIDVVGYGTVQGSIKSSAWTERKFMMFKNIKYASSLERFKPPAPYVPDHNEELDNSSHEKTSKHHRAVNWYKDKGLACPSLETLEDLEWDDEEAEKEDDQDMEDCLFLTVSTRNKTANQPVMVYLAGYDVIRKESDIEEAIPTYLLEKDIVLVSVQYRVGPFGFLSTLSNDIPGNAGILDVLEALRWVQKYISYFGGDPHRVTLFGQYHSAAIINVLALTPVIANENLFSQVIYQSGSALLDKIATNEPLEGIKKIAAYLNCELLESEESLNKCLKSAKTRNLIEAYSKYVNENKGFPFLTIGGPSAILPDFPKALYLGSDYRGYPAIGGSVKHPGVCEAMRDINSTIFRSLFTKDLGTLKEELEKIGSKNNEQIKYVGEKFPNSIFSNNIFKAILPAIIDVKGIDIKDATSMALYLNADKGYPSYLYAFNYLGFFSRLDCSKEVLNDVSLTDDNLYLFPYPERVENLTWKDVKMAKFMVDLWTSFAAMGSPSASGLQKWPTMTKNNLGPYLGIDFIYKMGYDYKEEYFATLKEQMKVKNIYDHN